MTLRVQEAAGSNPVTRTKYRRGFVLYGIFLLRSHLHFSPWAILYLWDILSRGYGLALSGAALAGTG